MILGGWCRGELCDTGNFPSKATQSNYSNYTYNHSFIKYYLVVTTRGKAEREGGGGAVGQKRVGGDPCSYRRGQTAPGAPPVEAAHQGAAEGCTRSPQAPALVLTQLGRPWKKGPEVQIVAKVTICAEEIFTAHSGLYKPSAK